MHIPWGVHGHGAVCTGHNVLVDTWIGRGIGIALVLIGGLWVLQGVGLVGGSFMTGSLTWLVLGLIVMASGAAVLVPRRGARRRR